MQIYVRGARSRFHTSGPRGTMTRPWATSSRLLLTLLLSEQLTHLSICINSSLTFHLRSIIDSLYVCSERHAQFVAFTTATAFPVYYGMWPDAFIQYYLFTFMFLSASRFLRFTSVTICVSHNFML